MNEKPTRVYLSGATRYQRRFKWYKYQLEECGFEVISPAVISARLPRTFSHDDYMHICLALLDLCSVIYVIPGSDHSEGVKAEIAHAEKMHIGNITHMLKLPPVPQGRRR